MEYQTDSNPNPVPISSQGNDSRVTVLISPLPAIPSLPDKTPQVHPSLRFGRWLLRGVVFGGAAVLAATVGAVVALTTPLPAAIAPQANKPLSFDELWQQGLLGLWGEPSHQCLSHGY
ncbi:MAG: hypothetical protein HC772_12510 [Leptolyngbyaceae cyanobacterium CRU_2_3]|nr:hypothetical protein [Leptolyngbyaceae cyanobacterium CRU_2_3]